METARRLADEHGIDLGLINGNAESVSRPAASFDFAVSEYGAAIWADPYVWIPEAWRLLRPGGELVFLGHHPIAAVCTPRDDDTPASRELKHPYFGMHRIDWEVGEDRGTEFNLPISEWMRLFRDTGFEILAFHEIRCPFIEGEARFFVTPEWAHEYPSEQVWRMRRR